MSKNRKFIFELTAAILAITPAVSIAAVNATSVAAKAVNNGQGKLRLIHNAYLYNKKGQRLWSYQGQKAFFRKNTAPIKFADKAKPITDPTNYKYSFHDDKWNWFYLPWKTIEGKKYYSVGHGAYIKVANVDGINGQQTLYKNSGSATAIGKAPITNQYLQLTGKYLKKGQKIILDRETSDEDLIETITSGGNSATTFYRIKGTNNFVADGWFKLKFGQALLPYSNYPQININVNSDLYDINGNKIPGEYQFIGKDHENHVDELIYIWVPSEHRAELFYRTKLTDPAPQGFFKASGTSYMYGIKLQPVNTAEEAQADIRTATAADKEELTKALNKYSLFKDTPVYIKGDIYAKQQYDNAVSEATTALNSNTVSVAAVKQATWSLEKAVQRLNELANRLTEK
ncbi:SLAP domain-containing protein [Lactobacillus sp. ESL0791]|uniref:SLAP domain-containing protein n=1 Tax=Lactobacillus sp. ESL0791 TaxID=2983234 RepID=UPI0023F7616B|nr:SLAP domain-containing protein [Lactobacillus sp. ESL0791]MDF7639745.1 SLAP domain-containing protein [Lactobacillus sp. ESL0791]